jgi:diguanylate cyclase (GGDEF)-like protein
MQNLKPERSIRWKLAAAFIAVACFVAAFVGVAIAIHFETVERAAQLEAGHVAELIADAATENNHVRSSLQDYVARLHSMRKRDVTVVDAGKKELADDNPDDVGKMYDADPGNEVGKTISDGRTRTFIEKSDQHPDGAHQIVIPLRQRASDLRQAVNGAVILEFTSIREELFAAERKEMYLIVAAGIVVVLLVTFFGLGIARRIAQPMRELKSSAERIAAQDYGARVAVTSHDEIGLLGMAFNKMAEDLSVSHAALVEHKRQLEERVAERTRELDQSNTLLQQEVREHQLAAERAEYLAYYDSLTTLPNRSLFSKLLNQALSLARRDTRPLAVLFLDLDRFKNINDTLGHEAGDLLLQEVGKRLQGCLRESDTVARLGGDEFVVLLPALKGAMDVEVVAHKILAATGKSFVAHGQEFRVTASVGASIYPKDGDDEQSLMKNADIAMYQAKEDGKNNFQFYSAQMNTHSFERLALESSLRRALEHDEFELHYQPKINARSGEIVGMEALLRWQHPELGIVGPTKFIPIAEETGLIVAIGKWVLKTACTQNVAWQQRGLPHLNMAVNLSGRQFSDEDLLRDVTSILDETGMSPDLLELEITESTLMHDIDKAIRTLKAFKDMGVRLAIDDFGTGYSSLSNLRQFPIDTIKIDGSFIRELSNHAGNRGIAEAIITMGRTLSLTVIAEGVETKAQADFLREQACDEFQGFYFSKAVTAGQFAELLEAQTTLAAEEVSLTLATE